MVTTVFLVLAYLLGSLSFAVLTSRAFGLPDPRSFGSKNPGATNVLRTGRKAAAALTLLGDAAKGWLAVFLALRFGPGWGVGEITIAGVAVAVFLGHLYPVWFGFHGGKGVATALGILLAINPWLGLAALAIWLTVALLFRTSSLAALSAALLTPACAFVLLPGSALFFATLVICLLLVWRHRSNIRNLLSGREGRIGQRAPEAPGQQ